MEQEEIKNKPKVKKFDMEAHDRKMKKVLFIFNTTFIITMIILFTVMYFRGEFKMPESPKQNEQINNL